ncbi:MAG: hypothetical protein ACYSR6_06230 [Planctomycetota bacterium]|jgi:hypothetical protein
MLNIFQQPWTILLVAVITSLAISIYRWLFPEKSRRWQLLVPLVIALAGFALDFLVKTDLEKIKALLSTGMKAVEQENIDVVDAVIAPHYSDSYHNTKEDLMRYCRMMLAQPLVEKNKELALTIEMSKPAATATFTVVTKFDPRSNIYQSYLHSLVIKMQLQLQKQPDRSWLITRAEVLELNRQPASWRHVR